MDPDRQQAEDIIATLKRSRSLCYREGEDRFPSIAIMSVACPGIKQRTKPRN